MKKHFKHKDFAGAPQDEPATDGLMNKVHQQLNEIERKLDVLINQSSKPSQSFSPSYGEKNFTKVICADCGNECEIPFKPSKGRPVYCKECFPKHKNTNPFSKNRDSRPGGGDFSGKRGFGKKQRPRPGRDRQPFYTSRKKRG